MTPFHMLSHTNMYNYVCSYNNYIVENFSEVLTKQDNPALTRIAEHMLKELGMCFYHILINTSNL